MFVKQKVVAIMTLGEIIKNYRAEHKMSMDAFSQKVGLSKAYISILERNFKEIATLKIFHALSCYLSNNIWV